MGNISYSASICHHHPAAMPKWLQWLLHRSMRESISSHPLHHYLREVVSCSNTAGTIGAGNSRQHSSFSCETASAQHYAGVYLAAESLSALYGYCPLFIAKPGWHLHY